MFYIKLLFCYNRCVVFIKHSYDLMKIFEDLYDGGFQLFFFIKLHVDTFYKEKYKNIKSHGELFEKPG